MHHRIQQERCPNLRTLANHFEVSERSAQRTLTFLREIKMRVMSFGADVVVVEPEELRREVVAKAQRMARIYST